MEQPEVLDEVGNVLRTLKSGVTHYIIDEAQGVELYHAYLELVEAEAATAATGGFSAKGLPNYQHFSAPDAQTSPKFYQ